MELKSPHGGWNLIKCDGTGIAYTGSNPGLTQLFRDYEELYTYLTLVVICMFYMNRTHNKTVTLYIHQINFYLARLWICESALFLKILYSSAGM